MEFVYEYGYLAILYLIFQVLLGTLFRLLGNDPYHDMYISLRTYIIILIPLFGILYSIFCILRLAFRK